MGIPKFFRYIAQRWPLTSQLVNGNVIPEFDNLYLDMNSIIHMSTHNNAENVGKLDEDEVFLRITNYIEHLFSVIQPKNYFFLAIDGVAPRAKMNQQRARRFCSAEDMDIERRKLIERGEDVDEDPFDKNCITPGTEFMMALTQQLQYFIARKVTEDSRWQTCNIILSGHEVPGEGEHKIMDFIRSIRSQPDYDTKTRHCLYGLDADLIMLGLSTHEPQFSLLREEVLFGRNKVTSNELCDVRFNLLHLSLVREYIKLELFYDIKYRSEPDFERMLDDVILILFLIGNDFLPELPMLLVNDGAIPVIFDTYKVYLKEKNNRYITENGKIDFSSLKIWLGYLKSYQVTKFKDQCKIKDWFTVEMEKVKVSDDIQEIIFTQEQSEVFSDIRKFMRKCISKKDFESTMTCTEEPKLVKLIAEQTGFSYNDGVLQYTGSVDEKQALRVLRIYSAANVYNENDVEAIHQKFNEWKNRYYLSKFKDTYDSDVVKTASVSYLEGLQWVLYYYYRSCPSWSWYYPYHYSTMTTELLSAIDDDFEPKFELGTPFTPFEQLMAVLPGQSYALVPSSLQHFMLDDASPLKEFYPRTVKKDKNGKKADWEAVVLLPFLDEKKLLKYVKPIEENGLTSTEKFRNMIGATKIFEYAPQAPYFYKSPSRLQHDLSYCTCVARTFKLPDHAPRYGLLEGSGVGAHALAGFPSLYTLNFKWTYMNNFGVKIFESPSRNDSVIIKLAPKKDKLHPNDIVYVKWPYLVEAKVVCVKSPDPSAKWYNAVRRDEHTYKNFGVDLGKTSQYIGVNELVGLVKQPDGATVKQYNDFVSFYPLQTVVDHVTNEDPRFTESEAIPLEEDFPVNSQALLLFKSKFYGKPVVIQNYENNTLEVKCTFRTDEDVLIPKAREVVKKVYTSERWYTVEEISRMVKFPAKTIRLLTARLMCKSESSKREVIGLRLRNPLDGLIAKGYCRHDHKNVLVFSDKSVKLIVDYLAKYGKAIKAVDNNKTLSEDVIREIKKFVRDNTADVVYVPTTNIELSPSGIQKVEQLIISNSSQKIPVKNHIFKGVDRHALLSTSHGNYRLMNQLFSVGDRVVFALNSGKIPFFAHGIVVGVLSAGNNRSLSVVWDNEYPACSNLNGALKTNRGLNVAVDSVLNLSRPQLIVDKNERPESKFIPAAKSAERKQSKKPSSKSSKGKPGKRT